MGIIKWNKTSIPCHHAMDIITYQGADLLKNYISLKTYQFVINTVKGRKFWPVSKEGELLPPMVKRMPS